MTATPVTNTMNPGSQALARRRTIRSGCAGLVLLAIAGCSGPMDIDMRGRMGGPVDTADAATGVTLPRPAADARGVISYPDYQVAVAERGDTVATLASRVGVPASDLALYNGLQPQDTLRAGEVVALSNRVPEGVVSPGAGGAITPAGAIDITTLAGAAIDRSAPTAPTATRTTAGGVEPVRHQVRRGETAFTIARLYNVTPRALADWNGLDSAYTLREGQYLLIPATQPGTAQAAPAPAVRRATPPGAGSATPIPPSASKPLPAASPPPAAAPAPAVPRPDIGKQSATDSSAAMSYPVQGNIIREYSKGRNDGIDIGAPAGTAVKSAAGGTVAAITTNTENIPIVVIKHPDNLLTVYTHIDSLSVKKGDSVSRGQTIGKVRASEPPRMHFEVRNGFELGRSDEIPEVTVAGEILRTKNFIETKGRQRFFAEKSRPLPQSIRMPRRPARSTKNCQATLPERAPRVACHSIASARNSSWGTSTP